MTDQPTAIWYDSVAKVASTIEGIQAVFAGGSGGQGVEIQPMIDEELMVVPAAVLSFAGGDIMAGSWEHQDFELTLDIWLDREPIGIAYAQAISFIGRVMTAFPLRAKGYNTDPQVQHLLVMSIGRITPRAWPEHSPRQFLVLPVTLQVRLARAAIYQPA